MFTLLLVLAFLLTVTACSERAETVNSTLESTATTTQRYGHTPTTKVWT